MDDLKAEPTEFWSAFLKLKALYGFDTWLRPVALGAGYAVCVSDHNIVGSLLFLAVLGLYVGITVLFVFAHVQLAEDGGVVEQDMRTFDVKGGTSELFGATLMFLALSGHAVLHALLR